MIDYPTGGTAYGKALQMQAFCQNCHDGNGAKRLGTKALKPFNDGKTAVVVSVHSNINFFLPEEARFQVTCLQCHTNANHGSTNLSVVAPTLIITGNLTTGPINFKSLTDLNSFDDGVSATTSRICVACHANPGDPGFPMTSHSGGNHPIMGDSRGENCTDFGCHMHDQDNNSATLDGFMSY